MDAFFQMLRAAALFAALTVPGLILEKLKPSSDGGRTLGDLLQYAAMPSLVFTAVIGLDSAEAPGGLIAAALIAPAVMTPILLGLSRLLFGDPKARDDAKRAAAMCVIFPNCGFFGIPLAAAVFPGKPEVSLFVALYNVTSTVLYLTLGTALISGKRDRKKALRSVAGAPVIWATVLALIFVFTGLSRLSFVTDYSRALSGLCTPLAMISMGMSLARTGSGSRPPLREFALVSSARLLVSPAVAVALSVPLQSFSFCAAMLISAGVSAAGSIPALFAKYRRDSRPGAVFAFGTALLSVLTLPALYEILTLIYK